MERLIAPVLLAAVFLAAIPFDARSATQSWVPGHGGGDGTWDAGVSPNWTPSSNGDVWTNGNDAVFAMSGGAVTVVNPAANSLTFSASGPYVLQSGTLTLTGSDVTVNSDATISSAIISTAGFSETGAGVLTLTGNTTLNASSLSVNAGTLNIDDDGTFSDVNGLIGAAGAVTASGTATWTNSGNLYVAESGSGTLSITSSSAVSVDGDGVIADQAGSNGMVTLSGTGATWTNAGSLCVANSGTGSLLISGGAVAMSGGTNEYGPNPSFIGYAAGSSGSVNVTGNLQFIGSGGDLINGSGSTWINDSNLIVGESGTGTLTISDLGQVNDYGMEDVIGDQPGSTGIVTVSGTGSKWRSYYLYVGNSGTGTLMISNSGVVSTNALAYIGDATGADGTATVSGNGSKWTDLQEVFVGESGTGLLTIENGGNVLGGQAEIGDLPGSNGLITVSGSGSQFTGAIAIGNYGTGTLSVTDGGLVSDGNDDGECYIGDQAGSIGLVAISGSGSTWETGFSTSIGNLGTGTLLISDGGVVSNSYIAYVGEQAGSSGVVSVSGTGSAWTGIFNLVVGQSGTGTLTISCGGAVSDQNGYDGGEVTVSGSGSSWTNLSGLIVGGRASGTLLITNGATVSTGNDGATIGDIYGGAVMVSGSGSKWTDTGDLAVGGGGGINVSLTITDGGSVSDANGSMAGPPLYPALVTVSGTGSQWTNSGDLNFAPGGFFTLTVTDGAMVSVAGTSYINDSTLQFDGSSHLNLGSLAISNGTLRTLGPVIFSGSATLVQEGTDMFVDTFGFNSTFSGSFTGPGGLAKSGSGTLLLTASSNYGDPTCVSAGALVVTGSLTGTSSTFVSSGATLEVDGLVNTSATNTLTGPGATLQGTGSVGAITADGGTIAPGLTIANSGSATGILMANGRVTLSSTTNFDIRLGFSITGTDSDQLAVTGDNAVALDGTLNLTLGSGINNLTAGYVNNLVYLIINGSQAPTGTFAAFNINASPATVNGNVISWNGYTFDIYYDVNAANNAPGDDVVLQLAAIPEPGAWSMLIGGMAILALSCRSIRPNRSSRRPVVCASRMWAVFTQK